MARCEIDKNFPGTGPFDCLPEDLCKILLDQATPLQYREDQAALGYARTIIEMYSDMFEVLCENTCLDITRADCDCLCVLGEKQGLTCFQCEAYNCDATIEPLIEEIEICDLTCDDPCTPQKLTTTICGEEFLLEKYVFHGENENYSFDTCTQEGADLYQRFLDMNTIKRYTDTTIKSVEQSIRSIWGEDANVVYFKNYEMAVTPGRLLTEDEICLIPLTINLIPKRPIVNVIVIPHPEGLETAGGDELLQDGGENDGEQILVN